MDSERTSTNAQTQKTQRANTQQTQTISTNQIASTTTQTQRHASTKQTQTKQAQPHKAQTQITTNTRPTTSKGIIIPASTPNIYIEGLHMMLITG